MGQLSVLLVYLLILGMAIFSALQMAWALAGLLLLILGLLILGRALFAWLYPTK